MDDRKTGADERRWARPAGQAAAFSEKLEVPARRHGQRAHGHRPAKLAVRFAPIAVPPPVNDPRYKACAPINPWALGVREDHPPAGSEPVEWMLLTTLAVTGAAPARVVIGHDRQRWQIEAWHRGPKQGCALESARLKTRAAPGNPAALLGVVALRLLQLRDLARDPRTAGAPAREHLPILHVALAARLAQQEARRLSVKDYWLQLAKLGGWLGRKKRPAARLARSLAGLAAPRPPRPRRRPVRSST